MSQLDKIIDNMKLESTVELEPYNFKVNGESLDYNSHTSTCEIDTVEIDKFFNKRINCHMGAFKFADEDIVSELSEATLISNKDFEEDKGFSLTVGNQEIILTKSELDYMIDQVSKLQEENNG